MEALPRLPCLLDTPEVDDTPFVHPVGFRMGPCKCPLCDPAGTAPVTFYEGVPDADFMEPIAAFARKWTAQLWLWFMEGCMIAWAFKVLGV